MTDSKFEPMVRPMCNFVQEVLADAKELDSVQKQVEFGSNVMMKAYKASIGVTLGYKKILRENTDEEDWPEYIKPLIPYLEGLDSKLGGAESGLDAHEKITSLFQTMQNNQKQLMDLEINMAKQWMDMMSGFVGGGGNKDKS